MVGGKGGRGGRWVAREDGEEGFGQWDGEEYGWPVGTERKWVARDEGKEVVWSAGANGMDM